MGDPATPTAKDRAETRELCRRIVQSVVEDAPMPCAWMWQPESANASETEDLVMQLAQEIVALLEERDEAIRVRDDLILHHDPFHAAAECFDIEMAKHFMGDGE